MRFETPTTDEKPPRVTCTYMQESKKAIYILASDVNVKVDTHFTHFKTVSRCLKIGLCTDSMQLHIDIA